MANKVKIAAALEHTVNILQAAQTQIDSQWTNKERRIANSMKDLARAAEDLNEILCSANPCCPEWPDVCGDECPAIEQ